MGNSPRIDPQDMHGFITDVAIKRRIRNYIQIAYAEEAGMRIIMKNATNINKAIAEAYEKTESIISKEENKVNAARNYACENFYDVRTFGAVLSTGRNAGQVRGPVQITFAKSVDAILPMDISITRMLVADNAKGATSVADYEKWEREQPEDKLRTMGRKQFISYGLYEARGFISANLADETGFDEKDLKILFESIFNMYEHDRSASKGQMTVISPLIIFQHVGTDSDEIQRVRQAKLGCAAAHKLFDLVHIERKSEVEYARSYKDYAATIDLIHLPKGVEVGFMSSPYNEISWGRPTDSWLKVNGE
jgi:CRISPR-associated protein Csd2